MRASKRLSAALMQCWLLGSALALSHPTVADATLAELQAQNRVQIKTWLNPADGIVVNQQLILNIEIATDTWFSAGTRFKLPEIDGVVIIQREEFATNSTRRQGGKSLAAQIWSLSLFPRRPGRFTIPPLAVSLSIAGEGGTAITGTLQTERVEFEAAVPEPLQDLEFWVASRSLRVSESYDRSLEDLKPGDAMRRLIEFEAEDIPAMMLPQVLADSQEGLRAYQKPPQLEDKENRGSYRSRRLETITYLAEKKGEYRLPPHRFYWWDLSSQQLVTIDLQEQLLTVSGVTSDTGDGKQDDQQDALVRALRIALPLVLALLIAAAALFLWRRYRNRQLKQTPDSSERKFHRQLLRAAREGDSTRLIALLYRWLDQHGDHRYNGAIRELLQQLDNKQLAPEFESIIQGAYATHEDAEADSEQFVRALLDELKKSTRTPWWRPPPIKLELY